MKETCFKEKIWSVEERAVVGALFTKLQALRSDKKMKREDKTKKIQAIKEEIQQYQSTFYGFKMQLGKAAIKIQWRETPITRDEIVKAKNELFKDVRRKRKDSRILKEERRSYFGFEYRRIGGVMMKSGTIKSLVGTVDDDAKLNATKAPHQFMVDNYIGVEIECIIGCSREYLRDKLIEANLQSYVQVKTDSSIGGYKEGECGVEIVLLAKENEVKSIVKRVCDVLDIKRVKGRANNSCGLHVHIDMRHRNVKSSYKNLYYGQNIMLGMVSESRRTGDAAERYCKKNDTPDYDKQMGKGRYHVINTEAYLKYKTLEVRVHGGTTNAKKINNWIEVLTRVVNYQGEELVYPVKTLEKFVKTFNIDADTADYIKKRTDKFADKALNEDMYVLTA